jgi:uncharacterized protein YggU (UPF0235/DUF167 family)
VEPRIVVRVKPGAARTRVGGEYGGPAFGGAGSLVVAVRERAVDGKATAAALAALAEALGVPAWTLRLVSGATGRDKIIAIADPPPDLADRIAALRAAG